ncbi:hypothetical protein HMPREF9074_09451 [Capnocytophaga sp. oral taxon 329 str. F0087]|nr:hypothetical protein HMPREF9074_09451 [Capnocytophaga sp. oral taxon 329 str. F0087]
MINVSRFILCLFFAYRSLILRSSFGVGISEVKGRYPKFK